MNGDQPAADSAHLTAHALARVLLDGPDLPVFVEDKLGDAPVGGVHVMGDTLFIDSLPMPPDQA